MKKTIIFLVITVFSIGGFSQKKPVATNINHAENVNIGDSGFAVDTAKKTEQVKKDTLPTYNIYQLTLDEKGWKVLLHGGTGGDVVDLKALNTFLKTLIPFEVTGVIN
jgi:hypothetical protein